MSLGNTNRPAASGFAMLWQVAAVLCTSMISAFVTADDDIKATLPVMETPPPTFDACVELGAYDLFGLTAQDRAVATTFHCVQLLHVPGEHERALQTQTDCLSHVNLQSI